MQAGLRQVLFGSATPYRGAMLALDFAGSSRTGRRPYYMLNGRRYARISDIPGWTYTGGTAAGVGSYAARQDGSLQFFPSYTNLILQSQTFDNASWAVARTAVTANQTTAPDGTTTADKLDETATTGTHYVAGALTVTTATVYTYTVYLKGGERAYAALYDGAKGQGKFFNLSTGVVMGNLVAAPDSATITSAGNGWWRCSITVTTASTTAAPSVYLSTDGTTFSYAGTAGSGIYIWGAQLELGSTASTYIPTTTAAVTVATPRITDGVGYWAEEARTNLLTYSQQFDNGAWTLTDATIVANVTTAPDGTLTADKLVEGTGASTIHLINQNATIVGSTAYAPAFYLKAAERSWALVLGQFGSGNFQGYFVNLTTGAIGNQFSTGASAPLVTSAGNGWWRVSFTATSTASTVGAARVYTANGNGGSSYTGDGTSGIYIWQADLQAGAFATSPIPTTSVAVTRAADVGSVTVSPGVNQTTVASYTQLASVLSDGVFRFFPVAVGSYIGATGVNNTNTGWYANGVSGVGASSNGNNTIAVATSAGGNFTASRNGGSPVTSASSDYTGSATRVDVGIRGATGVPLSGPIRRIVIYPRAFANSELQAITTAGAY